MEGDIPRPRAAATPLAGALAPPSAWRPRWYAHPYNRAEIYRVAAALACLPRPLRLRLASGLGRLAVARLPAERDAARTTLGVVTGATGRRLDALFVSRFADRQPPRARFCLAPGPFEARFGVSGDDRSGLVHASRQY